MSTKSRTSITLSPKALEIGQRRAKELGYSGLSPYLEFLIEHDCAADTAHVTVREPGGTYFAKQASKTDKPESLTADQEGVKFGHYRPSADQKAAAQLMRETPESS